METLCCHTPLPEKTDPSPTASDIFRKHVAAYREAHRLHPRQHKVMYDLFFENASRTLLEFGENPNRLGAKIGFYGILHTLGGKLWLHPHIHFIATAGGINTQGQWGKPKYNSTFLFPGRPLSNVFRAKFLSGLISAHSKGLLKLPFSGPTAVVKDIGKYTHSTAISNNRIISMENKTVENKFDS